MVLLKWKAPEYEHYHKSRLWLILFWIFFGALALRAFLYKSIIELILWITAGITITIYALREPKIIEFQITSSGIKAGNHFYSFDEIESFWIFYEPPYIKNVSFILKGGKLSSHLHIPLGDMDPIKVRRTLIKILPEKEQKESIAENIFRALRF